MTKRYGDWQQVYSGIPFWPCDPRADEINIDDIAHALSHQCRFGGHCQEFYSVSEHSVLVSRVVPTELALKGLLHDATEAYCVDVPRPIKPFLEGYKAIEDRLWMAIADHFGLSPDMPDAIKYADNAVLMAEAAQIMKPHPMPWNIPVEPADVVIRCLSPKDAKAEFYARFHELIGG